LPLTAAIYKSLKTRFIKGGIKMFKRNDGKGVNALQNRFTALLKTALRNRKIDYITEQGKRYGKEFPIVDYVGLAGDEYDFIQAIIDYDVLKTALKSLSDREKKIIVAHILEDKDFAEIGRSLGLTYKGTATAFYRAITKLRETLGRYRDEF
jgi:RNA polymerase sigma factor (sigma-70 family)